MVASINKANLVLLASGSSEFDDSSLIMDGGGYTSLGSSGLLGRLIPWLLGLKCS